MKFLHVIANLLRFERTNWRAATLCFIIAIIFWFFNALNKNYDVNINFPLVVRFDSTKYVAADILPQELIINVSGNGWNMLRKTLGFDLPTLSLPIEKPVEAHKIAGITLPALLGEQISDVKINHVVTDTLHFKIEPLVQQFFEIQVDTTQLSYVEGYNALGTIKIKPNKVKIKGPKSIVTRIPNPFIAKIIDHDVDENYIENIILIVPSPVPLHYTPPTVEVSFNVDKWETMYYKLPLQLNHVPSDINIDIIDDSTSCSVLLPRTKIEEFEKNLSSYAAIIDLQYVKKDQQKVIPYAVGMPHYSKDIRIDSVALQLYQ